MKTESSVLAGSAETQKFAYIKPTKGKKVIQKVGIVSLEVPREDPEESLRFNRVVEAG
jgi:hypothetical protein